MTSRVEICNLALSNIGKGVPISDLNEASEEARQCQLHYPMARDTLLQLYPWRFAEKTLSMAEVENDWAERWSHAYQQPSGILKLLRIIPGLDIENAINPVSYGRRGERIYCNHAPAFLSFITRIDDPVKFPPLFVDALSWALSARIAFPLTRDARLRQEINQTAREIRASAETSDANDDFNFADLMAEQHVARVV
ncbi:MAG: hypothetical protein JKY10_11560 [Cohaesibacteraceae bacterium]|nr:hypothetical protein [Cohaesibacteraceae bacterium]